MARRRRRTFSDDIPMDDSLLEYEVTRSETRSTTWKRRLCKCTIITLIIILSLLLILFILVFVVVPLVFMNSIEFQRMMMFQTFDGRPANPEFTNFRKYGAEGVRNFYVTLNDSADFALGVWHMLPQALVMDAIEDENFNYPRALATGEHPVILYFHGTGGHRITPLNTYRVLRRYFHVIAFDYRSYGDSSRAELTEKAVVDDCVQVYKWLRTQTKAEIFVWGHSLGTSLSSHTLSKLHVHGMVPMGLFLEAPFTTMREVMQTSVLTKIFAWMPWFEATMLDPVEENGFLFKTVEYVLGIDCPIMIFHAMDDPVVSHELSKKLYDIAGELRVPKVQGNLTYYLFPSNFGYRHTDIYLAPELTTYIKNHIDACRAANLGKG